MSESAPDRRLIALAEQLDLWEIAVIDGWAVSPFVSFKRPDLGSDLEEGLMRHCTCDEFETTPACCEGYDDCDECQRWTWHRVTTDRTAKHFRAMLKKIKAQRMRLAEIREIGREHDAPLPFMRFAGPDGLIADVQIPYVDAIASAHPTATWAYTTLPTTKEQRRYAPKRLPVAVARIGAEICALVAPLNPDRPKKQEEETDD